MKWKRLLTHQNASLIGLSDMLIANELKKMLLIALFLSTLLAGCGGSRSINTTGSDHVLAFPAISRPDGSLQNPYPSPGDDLAPFYGSPPLAELIIGEQKQTAALGSYCWIQEIQNGTAVEACQDSIGLPTPGVFLPSSIHFAGRLRLPLPIRPDAVTVYAMPVTLADTVQPPSDGTVLWAYKEGHLLALASEIEQDFQLELTAGLNVLYVDARWDGLGTAGYGFLIEVIDQE